MRILIIGNCGSGKSWLARKLSNDLGIEHIEMDSIFWEPDKHNCKRDKDEVAKEFELISKKQSWIVEGVFGAIADLLIESTTHLIWLDFEWDYCLANLKKRGAQFGFDELVEWAS